MAKKDDLFVERRPQGDDAVRRPNLERASVVTPTQGEGIGWAKGHANGRQVHVERVRHTKNGSPDKWRKP